MLQTPYALPPCRRTDALRVAGGGIMTMEGPYNLVEGGFAAGEFWVGGMLPEVVL